LSQLKRAVHVQIEESGAVLKWAFRHPPDLIITCARFLVPQVRRALPERYQEIQEIEAVPNAVDTERFFPGDKPAAKRRVGAPPRLPLLLMLANLAHHKGQETVIGAVAALKRKGVDAVCWLVGTERGGTSTYSSRLRLLIQEMGLVDRIHLQGQRDDVPELLRAADFLLLPSTCEGLPLSILEAQASKVPVLAAPTAGIPEVIQDEASGFLIAADDAPGYAACLESLLKNPNRYHQIAEAAYVQATQSYNWTRFCQRIKELYCKLIQRVETAI
jgi:glycosyltransferase involved in cell wall biosynthesis